MGAINSLASVFLLNSTMKTAVCSLCPTKDDGSDDFDTKKSRSFQYFPETINDTKGSIYAEKNIPGGSHPLYQWTGGSTRAISFSAIFSDEDNDDMDAGLSFGAKEIGGLAAGAVGMLLGGKKPKHTVDVAAAINWLRGFVYPIYKSAGGGGIGRVSAPPKAYLMLPGSGISSGVKGFTTEDSVPVIMTQCDVTYEGFFRNGKARFVTVQLSFNEIIQLGDTWGFVGRDSIWGKTGKVFEKYSLNPKDGRQKSKSFSFFG
jgi:hypothetical protein